MTPTTSVRLRACLALSLAAVTLAACGQTQSSASSSGESTTPATTPATVPTAAPGSGEKEVPSLTPRVLVADAGGLRLLDAENGQTLQTHESSSFLRLSDAGDGRHVVVADGDTFRVYDAGLELKAHGDHDHAYTYTPGLTDVTYPAAHAGHVVPHSGTTALFGDGDGSIQLVPTDDLAKPDAKVVRTKADAPHHGVAVWLGAAGLLTTQGTDDARKTVQLKRGETVVTSTDDCAGVHGEAVAQPTKGSPVVFFGCEDGPVVYRDKAFHKIAVREAYARTGNAAGTESSPIVLTDYKVDKDAEPVERPTRVALVNTHKDSLRTVELGSSYWFRSLGRGPHGEGLVLTYDGNLTVIDEVSGAISARVPVIAPWQEKEKWQEAGPILKVAGRRAYVTDAAKQQLVVVDLETRQVVARHALPLPAVEMAVVTGAPEGAHEHAGHHH